MKRGTPDHPKTLWLMTGLNLTKRDTVGLLEMLWHWTARVAPQGDIGKWTDAQIARGVEWEREPAELVRALVDAGFLDEDRRCRLLVHDWAEHADGALKKQLQRQGLPFCRSADKRRTMASARPTSEGATRPTAVPCRAVPGPALPSQAEPEMAAPPPCSEAIPVATLTVVAPNVVEERPWNQAACARWQQYMGSVNNARGARITNALRPLISAHGWPVVDALWVEFLQDAVADAKPTTFTPENFASTFMARLSKAAGARASPKLMQTIRAAQEFAEEGGSD